jgi:hypothetical protein
MPMPENNPREVGGGDEMAIEALAPGAWQVIRAAMRAVPATKYALGVAGIAAAGAIVLALLGSPTTGVIGVAVTIAFSMVVLLFAHLARQKPATFHRPAVIVLWCVTLLFAATLIVLFTSFFIGYPLDLRPGHAVRDTGLPGLGQYRCTVDSTEMSNCFIEDRNERTSIRFDAAKPSDTRVVHQIYGSLQASGSCASAQLSRRFATDDEAPQVGSAGTLDICKNADRWEGSWTDTKEMRFVLAHM